jgi:hypothetical protein
MRRWAATLICAFVVLTAAACTNSRAGIDGDLTDDWRLPPAAQQFRPADRTCHDELTESVAEGADAAIPCSSAHVAETIAVADLTGAAGLKAPSQAAARAFQLCSQRVDSALGGDWRTGWLVLQPVLPSKAGWSGGARWVRCDLAETSPADGSLVNRTGTLRGGLHAGSTLRMTCANPTIAGEQVTAMHPVTCSGAHTAEFAGLFPTTAKTSSAVSADAMEKGCDAVIAKFAGIPDDSSIKARVGWLGFPPDDTSWQAGDRSIRCFLWLDGEKMTGTYGGAGPSKLKIHYVYR